MSLVDHSFLDCCSGLQTGYLYCLVRVMGPSCWAEVGSSGSRESKTVREFGPGTDPQNLTSPAEPCRTYGKAARPCGKSSKNRPLRRRRPARDIQRVDNWVDVKEL